MARRPQLPPRLAEALLRSALPSGLVGDDIRGDLLQEYAGLAGRRGVFVAGLWFWAETLRLAFHYRNGDGMMGSFVGDLRHALRGLIRNPGFTIMATTTIALGLGANTAIFSVLRAVVLTPLT